MKAHVQKAVVFLYMLVLCVVALSNSVSAIVINKVGPVDYSVLKTIRLNYAADPIDMGIYKILEDNENHCWRIKDLKTGAWVVDADGNYPYTPIDGDVPDEPGQSPAEEIAPPSVSKNQFIDVRSLKTNNYVMVSYDALNVSVMSIKADGTDCVVKPYGNYYAIWSGDYKVYCDSQGRPYAAIKDQSATDIKYDYIDNSTNTVIKDSQILDIENGIFTFIDDNGEKVTLNIDSLYFDSSTNTYTTNVYNTLYDVTNNYYTYNYYTYSVTYNYQYTYVTYIGSTPEYKKEFEYYYELDDGRTSADLTAEDLAGLNIGFDVVNYDRVPTDTHTQALYHFDGNWNDSSYYSNQTNLSWRSGASITYLDANAFNGCLYLDSSTHNFDVYLGDSVPSDFTVQFRAYWGDGAVSGFTKYSGNLYSSSGTYGYIIIRSDNATEREFLCWDSTGFYVPCTYYYSLEPSSPKGNYYYKIADKPIGTWTDIAIECVGTSTYFFINGICYTLRSGTRISTSGQHYYFVNPLTYSDVYACKFSFPANVNSLVYLDELRVVDFAVYTTNYQPSPVPFDTNNVFVLPETENLKELTIAVQHDTPVSGFRVGGVRPTFPEKGLVWFPVEKSRITDCQIYNGSYWESVECRLWTGVRWIPLWAFDVFTLADCFDMADSGVLPPITSEAGFWSWWQKEWTSFRAWLAGDGGGVIGGGSGDGSSSFWTKIKDAITNGLAALIETLFEIITTVLKTLISVVTDLLSSVFSFLTDTVLSGIGSFFYSFKDGPLFEFFQRPAIEEGESPTTALPDDVATVFTFFSGVILLLPVELRALLFFAIAALVLISVFKLIKS